MPGSLLGEASDFLVGHLQVGILGILSGEGEHHEREGPLEVLVVTAVFDLEVLVRLSDGSVGIGLSWGHDFTPSDDVRPSRICYDRKSRVFRARQSQPSIEWGLGDRF
ncbi:hypothetical protein D3C72_1738730 [compost metagenome]